MKSLFTSIGLCFVLLYTQSALAKDIELKGNISNVIVYSLGAEVTHDLSVEIMPGQNTLIVRGVSPFTLKESIQIPDKDVTVINASVIKKLTDNELLELKDKKESYEKQIEALEFNLSHTGEPRSATNLKALIEYYDWKIIEIKKNIRTIDNTIKEDAKNTGEPYLKILVSTSKKVNQKISLKYIVGSAAWVPEYEVFVPEVNQNLKLKYIAKIMNKTGEDWNNVNVQLSLNSPFDKTGEIPKLSPIFLGSSSRTYEQEQIQQNNENLQQLDQLKIKGVEYVEYDAPAYTELLKIEGEKSIPANGGIYSYDVFYKELNTHYTWYSFPGLEEDTYLIGQVTDWDTLPLIDSDVRIYLRGINIGDSRISLEGFPDTLDIPIGKNKEVIVQRTPIGNETFTKENNNKIKETIAYNYIVKNTKYDEIHLQIFDQVPVSQRNKIEVEILEQSGSKYDEETGILTWEYDKLTKKEPSEFKLAYEVEFDKSRRSYYSKKNYFMNKQKVRKVRAKF